MWLPEPITEGPVKLSWRQSVADPQKVVSVFEVDFGKTNFSPEKAVDVQRAIVAILRGTLDVSLSKIK